MLNVCSVFSLALFLCLCLSSLFPSHTGYSQTHICLVMYINDLRDICKFSWFLLLFCFWCVQMPLFILMGMALSNSQRKRKGGEQLKQKQEHIFMAKTSVSLIFKNFMIHQIFFLTVMMICIFLMVNLYKNGLGTSDLYLDSDWVQANCGSQSNEQAGRLVEAEGRTSWMKGQAHLWEGSLSWKLSPERKWTDPKPNFSLYDSYHKLNRLDWVILLRLTWQPGSTPSSGLAASWMLTLATALSISWWS